jgi:hypothetical protein
MLTAADSSAMRISCSLKKSVATITARTRGLGPFAYVMIAILLPGGSIVALLIWLAQQWSMHASWQKRSVATP